jgi:hypothetical protein
MIRRKLISLTVLVTFLAPAAALGQTPSAAMTDAAARIRDEGMNRSEAMKTMRYLTDVIGPRLTNSPGQRRANKWTRDQFEAWGLKNSVVEDWGEFGRGWELKGFSASVTTPDEYIAFRAYPKAWSPAVKASGEVVFVDAKDEAGLEKYKGKLKGAIILLIDERPIKPGFEPAASRNSDDTLAKLEAAKPGPAPQQQFTPTAEQRAAQQFNARKTRFYYEEGAAVLVEPSMGTDSGTIRVMGANLPPSQTPGGNPFAGPRVYSKDAPKALPQLVAETEQYNRLVRLAKQNVPLKMTVDVDARFYDDDLKGYNTIAEIPGTDLKDEVVMIGAHLDSWHAGTGATDNGAGVTVVMEAMRILQASGVRPRRTIRVGLWTGEEQGLLGSRGYVAKHLATLGDGSDAAAFGAMGGGQRPKVNKKPAFDKFAAYYNLDNGTGQIRGIYMQGNEALRPIFKDWLAPFKDINASTVTVNSTGGTDHLAFHAVGLPGFQFIQDPVEYFTRTWHTTQDVPDRAIEEDLKRSAVIMASFAFNSAITDEKLPRKPDQAAVSMLSVFGGSDLRASFDEIDFRASGLGHSVCGHEIHAHEIPQVFPGAFTLSQVGTFAE